MYVFTTCHTTITVFLTSTGFVSLINLQKCLYLVYHYTNYTHIECSNHRILDIEIMHEIRLQYILCYDFEE